MQRELPLDRDELEFTVTPNGISCRRLSWNINPCLFASWPEVFYACAGEFDNPKTITRIR